MSHHIPTPSQPIMYYDGSHLVQETNHSWKSLYFLYHSRTGHILQKLFCTRWAAKIVAYYLKSRLSRRHIQPFIKKYHLIMGNYVVPAGGYTSFNDFFIRKLKPWARTIDSSPNRVISPVDGKLYTIQNIASDSIFYIKQQQFNLEKFLDSPQLASQFIGGTMMVFRLAPYDYHRIHFPVDGIPGQTKVIHGAFASVNPMAILAGAAPFFHNERHLVMIETQQWGSVAMLCVGALMVGSIVHTHQAGQLYRKGDECGYFAFGGSTVVLLFKSNTIQPIEHFTEHSLQGFETAVKMGVVVTQ
ncbi:MAG: archaetidylserine decarboxylase [Candidatus Babeliales bacterium]